MRAGCDPERKFGLFAVPALRQRSRGRRERLCLARKPTASVPLLYSYPQFRYSWLRSSNEVNSNDYDIPFWWSVALLFVALFGLPAVGYSADTRSMVLKGNRAYKAKHYARARALFDRACRGGDAKACSKLQ